MEECILDCKSSVMFCGGQKLNTHVAVASHRCFAKHIFQSSSLLHFLNSITIILIIKHRIYHSIQTDYLFCGGMFTTVNR